MKKKKNKLYEIFFNFDTFCIDSYESPEPYGEWRNDHQTTIGEVYSFEKKYRDRFGYKKNYNQSLKVDFKPKEDVYLVYGIYSTGDSFGWSENETEILDVFETEEEANMFSQKVEKYNKLITNDTYGLRPSEKKAFKKDILSFLGESCKEDALSYRGYSFIHNGKELCFPWVDILIY